MYLQSSLVALLPSFFLRPLILTLYDSNLQKSSPPPTLKLQIFSRGFGGGLSEISESKGEKKEDRVTAARVGSLKE